MIPVDILNSLKALALAQKPLITGAEPVANANTAFEPGQKYPGLVQAQISPGVFKVQVAEQMLQMQLPSTIRPGDKITLQVASLTPRLTFTMAATTASINPLATPDQLSSTARLLSSLAQQPQEKAYARPMQSAPLWTGKMQFPDTVELAGKLQETLSQSGLFYESHQAQWLQGGRNISQLMREPQNLPLNQEHTQTSRNTGNADHNVATKVNITSQVNAGQESSSRQASATQPSLQSASSVSSGNEHKAPLSIPEHLQPIVQQQLNALETHQVQWQGQIWPNQDMHWEIHEERARKPDGEEERLWSTQIQLDLPNLGTVTARLRFSGSGLSLTLDAADDNTRARMGSASSKLVAALGERGIHTSSAMVVKHETS